jgi:hypothetical protein
MMRFYTQQYRFYADVDLHASGEPPGLCPRTFATSDFIKLVDEEGPVHFTLRRDVSGLQYLAT